MLLQASCQLVAVAVILRDKQDAMAVLVVVPVVRVVVAQAIRQANLQQVAMERLLLLTKVLMAQAVLYLPTSLEVEVVALVVQVLLVALTVVLVVWHKFQPSQVLPFTTQVAAAGVAMEAREV